MAGKSLSGEGSGLTNRQREKQPDRGSTKEPKPSKNDSNKPSAQGRPKSSPEAKTRFVAIPTRNKDDVPKYPQDPKNHCLGCAKSIRTAVAETVPGEELEMCFRQSEDHNCEMCRKKNSSCEDVSPVPVRIRGDSFSNPTLVAGGVPFAVHGAV
jgi:hypothetical protein